jgi:hypothetical protein
MQGMGSKFSVLAPRMLLICQLISKDSQLPQNQCTYLCRWASKVEAHLPDGRTRDPGTAARLIVQARVNTQNKLAGEKLRVDLNRKRSS